MTQLSEVGDKLEASWNAVVDALMNHIQLLQHEVLATSGPNYSPCNAWYIRAMCQTAKTLTTFVEASHD